MQISRIHGTKSWPTNNRFLLTEKPGPDLVIRRQRRIRGLHTKQSTLLHHAQGARFFERRHRKAHQSRTRSCEQSEDWNYLENSPSHLVICLLLASNNPCPSICTIIGTVYPLWLCILSSSFLPLRVFIYLINFLPLNDCCATIRTDIYELSTSYRTDWAITLALII